jgi:hypothetical protein
MAGGLMDETTKTNSAKSSRISRREFARRAALASAVAAVAPAVSIATPAPQQPTDLPKLSPEGRAEVEARIQSIFSQYASRFSEAQKADLRRLCTLAQPPLDRLRAYALENGDGPGLYLKPLLEREKNPLENTRVGKTPDAETQP